MTKAAFERGVSVCYKCGSPTFIFLYWTADGDAVLTWFDTTKNEPVTFIAPEIAIETIEDFYKRKTRMELEANKRLYELPIGMDPENVLTIGFLDPDHKVAFMEKMFSEQVPGELLGRDSKKSVN